MTYEELKALFEAETNQAVKQIYGNHLRRMEGKLTGCGACVIDEPEALDTIEEDVIEPEEEL